MATRNLARTIVEGGRKRFCRDEEKEETASERRAVRDQLRKVVVDSDFGDEIVVVERGQPFYREFRDRIRPLYRFLHRQVGRNWDQVLSELREKYDSRTTKGWHFHDHVRFAVNVHDVPPRGYFYPIYDRPYGDSNRVIVGYRYHEYRICDFEIDRSGILRYVER